MLTGILFALATGLLFMLIGIVFSYAGTRVDILNVLLLQNLFLGILFLAAAVPGGFSGTMWLPVAIMAATGAVNILAMFTLQKAMALGNPGAAWAIAQSALVGPYVGALLFLGERPTVARIAGIVLILGGMALLGVCSKKSIDAGTGSGKGKYRWLLLAFLAFGLLVAAQYFVTASSRWSAEAGTPLRAGSLSLGSVLLAAGVKAARRQYRFRFDRRTVICVAGLTTLGLVSQSTIFITVDRLSEAGAAGIGYPVMMGSCIALFFLYTTLVLKEKSSLGGKLAVAILVAGIFFLRFS